MSKLPSVAIAGGASGHTGVYITDGFLSPKLRTKFSNITVFTRSADTKSAKAFAAKGVQVVAVDYNQDVKELAKHFQGIDIFIDTTGGGENGTGFITREKLMRAAAENGNVKVYIPPDFGVDWRKLKQRHPHWQAKVNLETEARKQGFKTVVVFPGIFTSDVFGAHFGFDTPNAKWELVGTPDTRISTTSIADAGLAVASLAYLAFTKPEAVPDHVRLSGQLVSFQEARDIFSSVKGIDITVTYLDAEEFRKVVVAAHGSAKLTDHPYTIANDIKLAFADGAVDNTEHENELVNPGETLWKWKTVAEYASTQA